MAGGHRQNMREVNPTPKSGICTAAAATHPVSAHSPLSPSLPLRGLTDIFLKAPQNWSNRARQSICQQHPLSSGTDIAPSSDSLIPADTGHLSGKRFPWQSTYTLLNSSHLLPAPPSWGSRRLRDPGDTTRAQDYCSERIPYVICHLLSALCQVLDSLPAPPCPFPPQDPPTLPRCPGLQAPVRLAHAARGKTSFAHPE